MVLNWHWLDSVCRRAYIEGATGDPKYDFVNAGPRIGEVPVDGVDVGGGALGKPGDEPQGRPADFPDADLAVLLLAVCQARHISSQCHPIGGG